MSLIYERKERVTILTLNRPEALNALDPETYQEFSDACMRFRDDPGSWVAIITGAGDKAFCAGADLKKSIPAVRKGAAVPPSIREVTVPETEFPDCWSAQPAYGAPPLPLQELWSAA